MTLASEIAAYAYGIEVAALQPQLVADAKTFILDALACTIAGRDTPAAAIAAAATAEPSGAEEASVVGQPARVAATEAVLVNGAMLRSLDLLDTFVAADVCHPSEIVPAALACAEAAEVSGRGLLEAVVAGYGLHLALARALPLHRHGLHHVGEAAFVVPPVAARLLGADEAVAARALTLMAGRLIVPEGFSRGHVATLKAFAYPLIARDALNAVTLAAAGLAGAEDACEEVLGILTERFGMASAAGPLVLDPPRSLDGVTLKMYPAQYALQPLIAAAAAAGSADPGLAGRLARVVVTVSRRTAQRTADPSKYAPASAEAADHSLPFCIAAALIDQDYGPQALATGRWRDPDVLALMSRIEVVPADDGDAYAVGAQALELVTGDGVSRQLECAYPPGGRSWRDIALGKLERACGTHWNAARIAACVDRLDEAGDVRELCAALRGEADD